MDALYHARQWAAIKPDTWTETAATFQVRFRGEVLVFHKRHGFVTLDDGRRYTVRHFRSMLTAKLGAIGAEVHP